MISSSLLRRLPAAFAALALLALAACGTTEVDDVSFDSTPADVIFNEALALLNANDYIGAARRFDDLEEAHPYSEYATRGMALSTFAYYTAGRYDDAIQIGRRYTTLHPGSEEAAYVQYLVAQSLFHQIPDVTLDQERTKLALDALRDLIRLYPESEYVGDARDKIRVVEDQLAGHEMTVGRYYLERRNYVGAVNRFRVVVSQYQTTRHVEEALHRLVECYLAMGIVNEAQTAAAVLGHNFPDSQWYRDSYSLLQSGGLEPSEQRDSWISRAFRTVSRRLG